MLIDQFKEQLNERQMKVILKMLESPDGFKGGMSAKKYISINKTSKATATRDLQQLTEMGLLILAGGGRSTHYFIKQELFYKIILWSRQESNLDLEFRKLLFYPLNYGTAIKNFIEPQK